MYWNEWAQPLKTLLRIENHPVAVTWSPDGAAGVDAGRKVAACEAVFKAAGGETVDITAASCGCQGGLVNLGLGEQPPDAMARLSDHLVKKARVYCSAAALQRGQRSVEPPRGAGEPVVMAPLGEASLQPDIVLFVCDAIQAEQIVSLCSYWDGGPLLVDLAGPMCRNALSFTLAHNRVGVSLLDDGARRRAPFHRSQMVVGVPLAQMHLAMAAMEQGAGRMTAAAA